MNRTHYFVCLVAIFALALAFAFEASAQQPLLQITAPASGSVVTEGQAVTISVAADPSVQIVGVITQSPLPEVQSTSSSNQFSLTVPTTVLRGCTT